MIAKGQPISDDCNLHTIGSPYQRGCDYVWRGHRAIRVLVVLVDTYTGREALTLHRPHSWVLSGQADLPTTISTSTVIAAASLEVDAVGPPRLSPLRRGHAIDSTVDAFFFYIPPHHESARDWMES